MRRNYFITTICLLLLSLTSSWGQEAHEFGNLSEGDIEWYYSEPSEDINEQWSCFTLSEPADIWVTLKKRDVSSSMFAIFDNEENGIILNEIETSDNQIRGHVNLPAGNYQLFVDFAVPEYMEIGIEVKRPDLELNENYLGTFDTSFSYSQEINIEDTYQFFHEKGYDGYACWRIDLEKDMDIDINLDRPTVTSATIHLLDNHKSPIAESTNYDGLPSLHLTNQKKGTYHILAKSYDESGSLVVNIMGHVEVGIVDNDTSTNHTIERTYTNAEGNKWNDKITYYDEMGREQETLLKAGSPDSKHDLADLTEYDNFGRISKKWLTGAVQASNGAYIEPVYLIAQIKDSHLGDSKPYELTKYEPSPINRTEAEYGTGVDWQDKDKAKHTQYLLNDPNTNELDCRRYSATGGFSKVQVKCEGSYPKGSLTVTAITNEDGQKSYEFKDGWGNVILNRQEVDGIFADTYYIYDTWGDLIAVLPPMASNEMGITGRSWQESDDIISSYAYLYAYDEQYRQIGIKLPGCDWEYTIYDQADTPVFTQDGEQRTRGEWSFIISDVWGRPCLEGVCKNTLTLGTELTNTSANYVGSSNNYGYAVSGIKLISPTYHKVTFYDNYAFLSNNNLGMSSLAYDSSQGTEFNTKVDDCGKGKKTGTIISIDGDMVKALKAANYYDYRSRNIQTISTNHLGGVDKFFKAYDFTDNCLRLRQIHTASGKNTYAMDFLYTYDHTGRPLTTSLSINGSSPILISNLEYDDLGRLVANNRNGKEKLRTCYTYNIRQWTKSITGDLFSEQLFYNDSHNGNATQYGGNISAMDWRAGGIDGKTRGYVFSCDKLNRLKTATYLEDESKSDNYSTSYSYDLMGNIETLTRNGLLDDKSYGKIDDLTYEYNGNQITKITDKVSGPYYKDAMHFVDGANADIEYEYDKNGCMTKDLNKKISKIEYNLLNLPTKLSFTDGSVITYTYDADGNKLSANYNLAFMNVTKGTSNTTQSSSGVSLHRDYCGNFIYEDGALKMLPFDGGYATFTNSNAPEFHFYIKDHLGNNRVVADANGNTEQVNHYYPFGGLMAESTGNVQTYKYNGKELDRIHGLDSYDYGARWMSDGRFTTPDPHATDYVGISPYAYCGNNPIRIIDLDGKDWYQDNKTLYYTWFDGAEEKEGFTYIGGKGSVLGEFEGVINNVLSGKDGLGMESIYSNGFTFDISPNDKGGMLGSKSRGWDFFDEFVHGTGPEFSVLLSNHPYTEALKKQERIKESQNIIRKRGTHGKMTNVSSKDFRPWDAPINSPMQFIGTYRYDGYSSADGKYINNIVTDSKSKTSLFYHLPGIKNHRRRQSKEFGNTYQFYIWRTKK